MGTERILFPCRNDFGAFGQKGVHYFNNTAVRRCWGQLCLLFELLLCLRLQWVSQWPLSSSALLLQPEQQGASSAGDTVTVEQQGCAQPLLLCSHSSQQQPLGFTGLAVVTLWLQGEFILQPCCLCVSPVLCYLASSRLAGALECSFRDAFCVSSSVCCRCKFLAFL